jgi:hypothetical protein
MKTYDQVLSSMVLKLTDAGIQGPIAHNFLRVIASEIAELYQEQEMRLESLEKVAYYLSGGQVKIKDNTNFRRIEL